MSTRDSSPIKELIANPTSHFDKPADVLATPDLSDVQKKKILDSWEEDARRLSVATEEGMMGGEPSLTVEVSEAKVKLGLKDKRHSSPTKAG